MNPLAITLLKEWLEASYYENSEGRYVDCNVCGADDTRPCEEDCLSQRTKDLLIEQTGDWQWGVK